MSVLNTNKRARTTRPRRRATQNAGNHAIKTSMQNTAVRSIPGFKALKYRAALTYQDWAQFTTGVNAPGSYVFSANGLFDPNITGTGHQPMAFDQLMLSYEHYCVMRTRCSVNFQNLDTGDQVMAVLSLNASPTAPTTINTLIENGQFVRQKLNSVPQATSACTLMMEYETRSFQSTRDPLDNPDLHGSVAANPVEQAYFNISAYNTDTVNTVDVAFDIVLEYDVIFLEPRKNSVSLERKINDLIIKELRAPNSVVEDDKKCATRVLRR